jgi:hypothetical protein
MVITSRSPLNDRVRPARTSSATSGLDRQRVWLGRRASEQSSSDGGQRGGEILGSTDRLSRSSVADTVLNGCGETLDWRQFSEAVVNTQPLISR